MDFISKAADDVQLHIAGWLDFRSLARLELVSRRFKLIASHSSLYVKIKRVTLRQTDMGKTTWERPTEISTNLPHIQYQFADKLNFETILPKFLHHILSRGADLVSMEILGKGDCRIEVEKDLIQKINQVFEEYEVKLESLAFCHLRFSVYLTNFLQHQSSSLQTLILVELTLHDSDAQFLGELNFLSLPCHMAKLRHLFLSTEIIETSKDWMTMVNQFEEDGQLQLLVVHSMYNRKDWYRHIVSCFKKVDSSLKDMHEKERLVMAVPGLNEAELKKGTLHSMDFMENDGYLTPGYMDYTAIGPWGD